MDNIFDTLMSLFQGAGASPDEAKAEATKLASHPDAASAIAPLSSSFDVNTSDNTVTQNGNLPKSTEQPFQMSGGPPAPLPPITPPASESTPSIPEVPVSTPINPPVSSPAKPVSPEPSAPSQPDLSALIKQGPSDEDRRRAALEKAANQKRMSAIPEALAGIGDAIMSGASAYGVKGSTNAQNEVTQQAQNQFEENKGEIEKRIKGDPNSDVSKAYRDMVTQIAPTMAKDPAFQQMSATMIGDKLPLIDTMMKAKASEDARKIALAQAKATKDLSLGLRQDQQQDKLEQQAKQMVSNLRGDKSLARTEEQRDAAAVAVNRLKEIQSSGKGLNPIDYTDILGQIYKARTGTAPSEQIMKDIHQATAKGSFDKAYTYVTGQQAPATTQAITASLMNMAQSMGQQADKFHQGYMNAHLIKPQGLDDARWQPIVSTGRGMSFTEATGTNATPATGGDIEAKRTALRQKLGI